MTLEPVDILREEISTREKRIKELERRVRWLESIITNRSMYQIDDEWFCTFCDAPDYRKHADACAVFDKDGKQKPTPEDFK